MINRVEVDLNAIGNNLLVIRKKLDAETKIIGVVKGNAYGHGLIETARAIWTAGAEIMAVASLDEAVELRVGKIRAPILVLGYIEPSEYRRLIDFDITLTLSDLESARKLSFEAKKLNKWARVQVKVDTGMSRYGFSINEIVENFQEVSNLEHIKIEGIYSHFADASDADFSRGQIREFQNVLFQFQKNRMSPPMAHMAATEGIFRYSEAHFEAVRVGLGLYGYYGFEYPGDELIPALTLKSKIAQIKRVGIGQSVGYKRTFTAKAPMKIAVVPIGYADGYPRALSNIAEVIIDGKRVKVVGRICMNALMADVTGIKVGQGDDVILIGSTGSVKVYADEIAKWADTNPHEIISRISPTLPREYHFK